jgi:hypothetical protein
VNIVMICFERFAGMTMNSCRLTGSIMQFEAECKHRENHAADYIETDPNHIRQTITAM